MALDSFKATIWSQTILGNLHKATVYGSVCNRDYEGTIVNKGDTVQINSVGAMTVKTYTEDVDMSAPDTVLDASRTLVIDQANYVNFQVDDISAAQANVSVMADAINEATYALRDTQDSYLAALHTGAAAANLVGATGTPKVVTTAGDLYDNLVDTGVKLSESNINTEGRWVILPPFAEGLLLKDDRFVHATAAGDGNLANGRIGRAAGFDILISNNVATDVNGDFKIMAGNNRAITLADAITKMEAYRLERRFADGVKFLHLYGAKVIQSKALAVLTLTRPA